MRSNVARLKTAHPRGLTENFVTMNSCKRYYYLRDIIQHISYAPDLRSVGEGAQPILREMENIQSSKDTTRLSQYHPHSLFV